MRWVNDCPPEMSARFNGSTHKNAKHVWVCKLQLIKDGKADPEVNRAWILSDTTAVSSVIGYILISPIHTYTRPMNKPCHI